MPAIVLGCQFFISVETTRKLLSSRVTGIKYAYVGGDPVDKTDPRGLCSPDDNPPCYPVTVDGGNGGGDDDGTDGTQSSGLPGGPQIPVNKHLAKIDNLILYTRLPKAIAEALKLLNAKNMDCLNFLSGNGLVNPIAVLNDFAGGSVFQVASIQSPPNTVISATTTQTGLGTIPSGDGRLTVVTSVSITINDLGGTFVQGSLYSQGTTILHELGHALYAFYGPIVGYGVLPQNYGVQPDSTSVLASINNTAAIQQHCH